jgi:hypothetical protein
VFGQVRLAGFGQGFHPLRQTDGVPEGGVVHGQVIADAADHDFSGVEAKAGREAEASGPTELIGVGRHRLCQFEGGGTGAPGVILVGDGGAEQRHDPVPRELVDRPLEVVDPVRQRLKEALHDARPFLRIESRRQVHRAFDVGEEDGHLLALSLESRPVAADLLRQMIRGGYRRHPGGGDVQRSAAPPAEPLPGTIGGAAAGTCRRDGAERAAALGAEPPARPVGCPARGAAAVAHTDSVL